MKTEITRDIDKAAELLVRGEVVAIPTETVYGLAANALDEGAVNKIFEAKERPHFNPLIIHIPDAGKLNDYTRDIPDQASKLANAFWPGPLTLVLPKKDHVPDIVTAGKSTVAIRVPDHEVARDLLYLLDFPLAAPSANPFGQISPTEPEHVKKGLDGRIPLILDGGPCQKGIESTIVGFEEDGTPVILRPGSITMEEIEKLVGKVKIRTNNNTSPEAPGMLDRHYSPDTPSFMVSDPRVHLPDLTHLKVGLLSFGFLEGLPSNVHLKVLSHQKDLKEASSNLYRSLHELDSLKLDVLLIQRLPDSGLGCSINDRLKRASKGEQELTNFLNS